jgi:hypothetical protein
MGSPRVDLVFRLWQCDKENHRWREGSPQTVLPSSIGWLAFTLLVSPCRTKKEYCFLPTSARLQNARLAGISGNIGSAGGYRPHRNPRFGVSAPDT